MPDIQSMIAADSDIDISAIADESVKVIPLHAKYLGIWQEEKMGLMKYEEAYKKLRREKVDYYLGRADDETYVQFPLNLKIPRQDLDFYLDADNDLCAARRNLQNAQNKVDLLKAFIEQNLNQRSHHFRNALAFLNWSNGK